MQPALPGASAGNQTSWHRLQLTAKWTLTLTNMRKSGNVSFDSPAGRSLFSISQQVSPACFPILSNTVNPKHSQQRPSTLTPNMLPAWPIYSPSATMTAEWRFAQKAASSCYSFRSISTSMGSAVWLHCYLKLPGRAAGSSWILNSTQKIVYKQN